MNPDIRIDALVKNGFKDFVYDAVEYTQTEELGFKLKRRDISHPLEIMRE